MARVTVEDCTQRVSNRFDLVVYAAKRANELRSGIQPKVEKDNDRETVIALREIATKAVSPQELHQRTAKSLQRITPFDEDEDEITRENG